MHDRAGLLPEWAVSELRRPVPASDAFRERVMTRVRAAARPLGVADAAATSRAPVARRGLPGRRMPISGALLALAASVAWLAFASTLFRSHAGFAPELGSPAGRMIVLGDTVDSALHDTLRLVRFVLHAPGAARVAISGDFNGWSRTATPLADSAGSGVWSAVVALDRDSRRYAFVVDGTRWVEAERVDRTSPDAQPLPIAPIGGDST